MRIIFIVCVLILPLFSSGYISQLKEDYSMPGLSYDTNESVLKDAFKDYGEVVEGKCHVILT